MELEYCFKCGEPTGRAGAGDDSIYDDAGNGPYCEDCYDDGEPDCSECNNGCSSPICIF